MWLATHLHCVEKNRLLDNFCDEDSNEQMIYLSTLVINMDMLTKVYVCLEAV